MMRVVPATPTSADAAGTPARHLAARTARRGGLWTSLTSDALHGPLPILLVALTVFIGVVDAVSILALGRVFVANMTGNVVFVGFALAGATGFSLVASLTGLAGFIVGATAGGRIINRLGHDLARLLATGATGEVALVASAFVLTAVFGAPPAGFSRVAILFLLSVATGAQNAIVRRLAVPDLTATVLTMTLTGLAADVRSGNIGDAFIRRVVAVLAMLVGAIAGALLVLHAGTAVALALATAILAAVAIRGPQCDMARCPVANELRRPHTNPSHA